MAVEVVFALGVAVYVSYKAKQELNRIIIENSRDEEVIPILSEPSFRNSYTL